MNDDDKKKHKGIPRELIIALVLGAVVMVMALGLAAWVKTIEVGDPAPEKGSSLEHRPLA